MSESLDGVANYLYNSTDGLAEGSSEAAWSLSGGEPLQSFDPFELSTYAGLSIITTPVHAVIELLDIITSS